MATSLRDNLTSSYFNAAHKLYSKKARRRIIAYVESYDDVAFWRTLLERSTGTSTYSKPTHTLSKTITALPKVFTKYVCRPH